MGGAVNCDFVLAWWGSGGGGVGCVWLGGTELAAEGLRGLLARDVGRTDTSVPGATLLDRAAPCGGWLGGEACRAAAGVVGGALWTLQRDGEALGACKGPGVSQE